MSKQASVAELSVFRELTGAEMKEILAGELIETLHPRLKWTQGFNKDREEELRSRLVTEFERSGHFKGGDCYPVVRMAGTVFIRKEGKQLSAVFGSLLIKVLPAERDPKPWTLGFRVTFQCDGGDTEALVIREVAVHDVSFVLEVGTKLENHPDKLREKHNLEVKQPKVMPGGGVRQVTK